METSKLTVVITTYNREKPLISVLKGLEKQGLYDKYRIIVSDNHSNYDVREVIQNEFRGDFLNIIEVRCKDINIGGNLNLLTSFTFPKTDWMWLLSDDDPISDGALSTILEDIERYNKEKVTMLKYSIEGSEFHKFQNETISSIEDYFNVFSEKYSFGEMVFMSNCVYSLKSILPFISNAYIDADTAIPQIILPLYSVKFQHHNIILRDKCVTRYTGGQQSYSYLSVYVKFGNVLFSNLQMNNKEINAFKKLHIGSVVGIIYLLLSITDRTVRYLYFSRYLTSLYHLFSLKGLSLVFLYLLTFPISLSSYNKQKIREYRHKLMNFMQNNG